MYYITVLIVISQFIRFSNHSEGGLLMKKFVRAALVFGAVAAVVFAVKSKNK